jgi:3-phenylpropionate/trans-cinnamate dioxygenase ferredoxin subunit
MGDVRIRVLKDGPYEVSGTVRLVDHQGADFPPEDPVYLCRCGRSANRPFCDGTHKKVGFQAAECVRLTSGC